MIGLYLKGEVFEVYEGNSLHNIVQFIYIYIFFYI